MADLIAPLRAHAPFDEMEPAALDFVARHLAVGYHPRELQKLRALQRNTRWLGTY